MVLHAKFDDPLAKFPGTRLAGLSNIPYSWSFLRGRQPYDIHALHEKFGPIVRIAPNELSFSSAQSWQDIYGTRPGHDLCIKSAFYQAGDFASQASSVVTEQDPAKHKEMRKYFSNSFSEKALKKQEYLVNDIIDRFIRSIGSQQGVIDMTVWFNLLTFDIIGELSFGESFRGVDTGKVHPWVADMLSFVRQHSLGDALCRFPLLSRLIMAAKPKKITDMMDGARQHARYNLETVRRYVSPGVAAGVLTHTFPKSNQYEDR